MEPNFMRDDCYHKTTFYAYVINSNRISFRIDFNVMVATINLKYIIELVTQLLPSSIENDT